MSDPNSINKQGERTETRNTTENKVLINSIQLSDNLIVLQNNKVVFIVNK